MERALVGVTHPSSLHCHVVQMLIMFARSLSMVTRDSHLRPSHHQEPSPDQHHPQTGKPRGEHAVELSDRLHGPCYGCVMVRTVNLVLLASIAYTSTQHKPPTSSYCGAHSIVDVQRLTNYMHDKLQGLKVPAASCRRSCTPPPQPSSCNMISSLYLKSRQNNCTARAHSAAN